MFLETVLFYFISLINLFFLMVVFLLLFLLFFLTSLLEYNCFTMVCYFLLYNKVNQLYIYICPHISSLLHLPPSHPSFPTTLHSHKALSWSPCAMRLLPTSYFRFGTVYMPLPLSHFVPAYPSPSPYPQVHSLVGLHLYSHLAPRFFMTFFF